MTITNGIKATAPLNSGANRGQSMNTANEQLKPTEARRKFVQSINYRTDGLHIHGRAIHEKPIVLFDNTATVDIFLGLKALFGVTA
jgi:hypothetical protein